jgi:hypothetical protein
MSFDDDARILAALLDATHLAEFFNDASEHGFLCFRALVFGLRSSVFELWALFLFLFLFLFLYLFILRSEI